MNKNVIWIFLIFLIPVAAYWGLTRESLTTPPSVASEGDVIIKFSSPMCYECQELEKVFEEVYPEYEKEITLKKIDVTKRDKNCEELIQKYEVKLVPTTVFKNQDGKVFHRIEGTMHPHTLKSYLKELING